jgi:hypothetical protein
VGQNSTQKPQPLQRSMSMCTSPRDFFFFAASGFTPALFGSSFSLAIYFFLQRCKKLGFLYLK